MHSVYTVYILYISYLCVCVCVCVGGGGGVRGSSYLLTIAFTGKFVSIPHHFIFLRLSLFDLSVNKE